MFNRVETEGKIQVKGRQTDRLIERQIDRQTDRQMIYSLLDRYHVTPHKCQIFQQ